ncbi:MAG: KH domain-containing protein [Ruminococcus sp.]|nr:KH domain-containing protein [Ruminococcus sp.]
MNEIFVVKKMDQAKKLAAEAFGVSEDLIVFRVLEEKKGFFGKMKVEAIYEAPEAPKAAETPAAVVEEAVSKLVEETAAPAEEMAAAEVTPAAVLDEEEITEETEAAAEEIPLDELSENLAAARTYIIAIYEKMGVAVDVTVSKIENGILMNVTSESKSGTIIGRRGETLDSIQYLASIIANRGQEDYSRIMLDSNGYRTKRRKTLEQLAEKIAKNVLRSGRSTTLEPMNPYERRIIHSKIAEIEGVVSHSVGEDPYRKVVVASVNGGSRKGRGGNNNRGGHHGRGGKKPYREKRPEDFKPSSLDNMKTSFEKDYKKPRPEDEFNTGLYGKIEL